MAVNLQAPARLDAVPGVRLGAASLGVRAELRDDLALIEIAAGAAVAAVFTRNAFRAAPITVAQAHLAAAAPRYLLVNAGNANAGTGPGGLDAARRTCELVAERTGCEASEVLPFSTGVIGEPLDTAPFAAAIDRAAAALAEDGWLAAGAAIMTTDTVVKGVSRRFRVGDDECTITGIVKGAGMIRPDMATMLAFLATDVAVSQDLLQRTLARAVEGSFNRATVDGDTSTNDACVLIATGASKAPPMERADDPGYASMRSAVHEVCVWLAQAMVRDGEGATKFVTVEVGGGACDAECLQVAHAVAQSPLVKTALFASDANWGRILAAVGRAGVPELDIRRVNIRLGDVAIVESGARAHDYREADGARVMARPEIAVHIDLGRGDARAEIWTCDFSHDYVTINAEYRT